MDNIQPAGAYRDGQSSNHRLPGLTKLHPLDHKATVTVMHILCSAPNISVPGGRLSGTPISDIDQAPNNLAYNGFQNRLPRTKPESPSLLEQEMSSIHPKPPRPQFQHYVPRFLLRRWVTVKLVTKRGKKKPQIIRRECMNSYDIGTDTLTMGGTPIETTYGIVNMYRDEGNKTDVDHIEKAFSRLESDAARIIQKIDKAVEKGEVTLPRGEVNTLRKFLFLLSYRNDHRSRQFIDEIFDEATCAHIREFQTEHGLKDTKAVWLFNIKNMLDSEHWEIGDNPKILWADRMDYKAEQEMFQLGFFCVPQGFEFINTGSMGLFEGSEIINPIVRMLVDAVSEKRRWRPGVQGPPGGVMTLTRSWPLTPRLVVMLRNRILTDEQLFLAHGLRPQSYDFLPSYYHDFPRTLAAVTYNPPLSPATRRMMSGAQTEEDIKLLHELQDEHKLDGQMINTRLKDTLKFQVSALSEDQAARVNVLLLKHCAGMINFTSRGALRKSLKCYANDRTIVMEVNRDTRFESLDRKLEADEKQAPGTS